MPSKRVCEKARAREEVAWVIELAAENAAKRLMADAGDHGARSQVRRIAFASYELDKLFDPRAKPHAWNEWVGWCRARSSV